MVKEIGRVSGQIPPVLGEVGDGQFDEASAEEQVIVTVPVTTRQRLRVWLDLFGIESKPVTLRLKTDVSQDLRTFEARTVTPGEDVQVYYSGPLVMAGDLEITLEGRGTGSGTTSVPYAII